MKLHGYPFIHPLLGADDAWNGFNLELAADAPWPETCPALQQTPEFPMFDRRHSWFIPACRLQGGTPDNVIPVFPAERQEEPALRALAAELRQAGRHLALRARAGHPLPATGAWDYLLISTSHARTLPPYTLQGLAARTVIVTTGIQNHCDREWVIANGSTLSTGEFLLSRGAPGKRPDSSRQRMLTLLALIAKDADTSELDNVFRQEPKLSYSLLRLVNSAAVAPRTPITSFAQAINLLGRRQLERWLQLLIYADPNNGQHPNPLLYKAATRGRLLELLAELRPELLLPGETPDTAFMTGCFSLLDVLLNLSMGEILAQLPLSATVQGALAGHNGPLGHLLTALEAADCGDLAKADMLLGEHGIAVEQFLPVQLSALGWVGRIRPTS